MIQPHPMPNRIIIIGGVAGGASAATKARREDDEAIIEIYERGPYVSFANCGLPYYIGGEIKNRDDLLIVSVDDFWQKHRVQVFIHHEAVSIDPQKKQVSVITTDGKEKTVLYDQLILSQGAVPVRPPLPGIEQAHVFFLSDIQDMDAITAFMENAKPSHAVIIGGGFIGLEMAEALRNQKIKVSIVEQKKHVLPLLDDDMGVVLLKQMQRFDFEIFTGMGVSSIEKNSVTLENDQKIASDMVIVSAGVKPEIKIAKRAGLEIGESGGIKVNGRLQSNFESIYAVGDAAETTHHVTGARVRVPLAGPANRQGRIAGGNAAGKHMTYSGVLGTSIVRVIDVVVGIVGLNSEQAESAGLSFFSSVTRDPSHADYYPGASELVTKILVENSTGRILGGQLIGKDGVDKRIDVLATAIYANMSVDEIQEIDLAYAPPFGSANDPLNQAGFVAGHMFHGDIATANPKDGYQKQTTYIDVRETSELEKYGMIENGLNIPLNRLDDEIERIRSIETPIVIYCQTGQRGYLVTKKLQQRNIRNVANLSGGYLSAQDHQWKELTRGASLLDQLIPD